MGTSSSRITPVDGPFDFMPQPMLSRSLIGKILASPGEAAKFLYHLPKLLQLIHILMKDKRVSMFTKCIPLLAIVYIVYPIDIIKEFMFGPFGYIDDIVITYYLLKTFIKMCPEEVVREHVQRLSMKMPRTHDPEPRTEEPKG